MLQREDSEVSMRGKGGGGGFGSDVLPMGDLLPYAIMAKRSALISPQTVLSRDVSPISMKYLHNCVCTTAARYQHICETTISKEHGLNDDATYSHEWM